MEESFGYAPGLIEGLQSWARSTCRFATFFVWGWWLAALGFALLHESRSWAALPIAAVMHLGAAAFRRGITRLQIKFAELASQRILITDGSMSQVDVSGEVLGTIDLNAPFEVNRGTAFNGNCVFEVRQASAHGSPQRVEFGSTLNDAQRLVRDILRSNAWPRNPVH